MAQKIAKLSWEREIYHQIWQRKLQNVDVSRVDIEPGTRLDVAARYVGEGDSLLDVGCGDGSMAVLVGNRYKKIYGLDITSRAVEIARIRGVEAEVIDLNKNPFPYEDNVFDTVLCLDVVEHVLDPENLLAEAYRVLKEGGRTIVSTPNMRYWKHIRDLIKGRFPKTSGDCEAYDGGHLHYFTFKNLEEILSPVGFIVVDRGSITNRIWESKKMGVIRFLFGDNFVREFGSLGTLIVAEKKSYGISRIFENEVSSQCKIISQNSSSEFGFDKPRISWLRTDKLEKQSIIDALWELKDLFEGTVLDLGCGEKPYRFFFNGKVKHYVGVDLPISAGFHSNKPRVDVHGDAMVLPFRNDSIDVALSVEMLEYVPSPDSLFKELKRVVKVGGLVVLIAPQTWGVSSEIVENVPSDFFRYTLHGLRYLAESNGFRLEFIKPRGGFWMMVGQRLSCILFHTVGQKRFLGKPTKVMCALVQMFHSMLDKWQPLHSDTLGYVMLAKKLDDHDSGANDHAC